MRRFKEGTRIDFPSPWEKADLLGYTTKRAIAEEEQSLEIEDWTMPEKCNSYGTQDHCEFGSKCPVEDDCIKEYEESIESQQLGSTAQSDKLGSEDTP